MIPKPYYYLHFARFRVRFSMNSSVQNLSVIMPCFNEAENIQMAVRQTSDALIAKGIESEIIVVDDGSEDDSRKLVEEMVGVVPNLRQISRRKNGGIGAAFRDGIMSAAYDYVVMIPGDNENDVSEVLAYFGLVDKVDLVIPFVQNTEVRHILRRLISASYRWIVNLSFGTNLNYTNGTIIYNRAALTSVKLATSSFFFQTELLIKLLRLGFLYAEVPQLLRERAGGRSKALTFRSLVQLVKAFCILFVQIHLLRLEGRRCKPETLPRNTATARQYRDRLKASC
jgi:dolichol-phosphate mannosyltransferase